MRIVAAALVLLAVLAPLASAHETPLSGDGKVRFVIGLLNEPVYTNTKTGLDLCITDVDAAKTPITDVQPGALDVTLTAPNGVTMNKALKTQFGRPGCFTFVDQFFPTMPGQYTVTAHSKVHDSDVDLVAVKAGGAVSDSDANLFPDANAATAASVHDDLVADKANLQAHIDQLKADNAALENRLAQLETQVAGLEKDKPAPVAPVVGIFAVLLAAALVVSRRKA